MRSPLRPARMPAAGGRVAALAPLAGAALVTALALLAAGSPPSPASPPGRAPAKACAVFPDPPAGLPADAPSLADQRAWNQPIAGAPLDPDSEAILPHIDDHGAGALHPDFGSPRRYGIPLRSVGERAKRTEVRFTAYGAESDHGPYRIPLSAPVEGGRRGDGDRHVIVYDRARCRLYELYRAFPRPARHRWDADSGVIWNLRSAALRRDGWTSADAAGLPIFPGLVRYGEVRRGRVEHAIRITFESTRDAWIHPATHCAGDTADPAAPAMGTRLRLRAGYDISSITGQARPIAEALRRYGAIVADNGSNWFISGAPDRRWDDRSLEQLKAIPGSAFEVVRSLAPAQAC